MSGTGGTEVLALLGAKADLKPGGRDCCPFRIDSLPPAAMVEMVIPNYLPALAAKSTYPSAMNFRRGFSPRLFPETIPLPERSKLITQLLPNHRAGCTPFTGFLGGDLHLEQSIQEDARLARVRNRSIGG